MLLIPASFAFVLVVRAIVLVLAPSLDNLTVSYDATRLRPEDVESALASAGLPVERANVQ